MRCENVITLWTPKGRQVPLPCGRTGFSGELVLCDKCEAENMRQQILSQSDEPEDREWLDI